MGKYDGSKCLSCGKEFTSEDDVVVCPECGTPYHRSCYEKEGQCINIELHEKGGSWQPETDKTEAGSGEPIRCSRCGQENPAEGLFCNRCGMPLRNVSNEERPFNDTASKSETEDNSTNNFGPGSFGQFADQGAMRFDQDSDIDGVKLGDLARYVGKNQFSYLTSFIRFGKFGGKLSINFSALLFPQFYFFYRKMNLIGIIYLVLTIALSVPTMMVLSVAGYLPSISFVTESFVKTNSFSTVLNLSTSLLMVLQCLSAIFANYWYYRQARKDIQQLRSVETESEEDVRSAIIRKGGVSLAAFFMSVLVSYALMIGTMFVMNKFPAKETSVSSTSSQSSTVSSAADASSVSGTQLVSRNGILEWACS